MFKPVTLRAILQFCISLVALLGINAVPTDLVLLQNNSAATAMILYYLEAMIAVILAAARVRILAPAEDPAYIEMSVNTLVTRSSLRLMPHNRQMLIREYLLAPLGLWFVVGIFIFLIVFFFGRQYISGVVVLSGMGWIAAFQLFYFVADLFLLGHVTPAQAENILRHGISQVALISFAVFIGVIVGMGNVNRFILPFIALKTLADVAITVQIFRRHLRISKL